MKAVLGELGVGLVFGLSLTLLNEALMFAGMLLGMQFSFSLVNLLDPNSKIETPVLGQMLGWLGMLVMIGAGLDRACLRRWCGAFALCRWDKRCCRRRQGWRWRRWQAGYFWRGCSWLLR